MLHQGGSRYPQVLRRQKRVEVPLAVKRRQLPSFKLESLPLLLVLGFALAIVIGTILLLLPWSSREGTWTSPAVALFVATSAVCVTGLVPVDTATHWSAFGQVTILILIQFGGFGLMTSATILFLLFGWRLGIRERIFLSQSMDFSRLGGVVRFTRRAIAFTIIVELTGFIIFTMRFALDEPLADALWQGLFHSISAFNNAGFDVFGQFESLEGHRDFVTLTVTAVLVIVGGIGFLVFEDIQALKRHKMTLDTRIVLSATAALLVVGALLFAIFEWHQTLSGMAIPDKLLQSFFHSVSPRTAGFNSVPVTEMKEETLLINMALMFIGGASGSTAGGIKVGTFAVVILAAFAAVRGRSDIEIMGRRVRRSEADRALAVVFSSVFLVFVATAILAAIEDEPIFLLLFEAVSAFGTVGLSAGITPNLSDESLLLISLVMFAGRLGPLTLVLALIQRDRSQVRRLPEERVRIG